MDLKKKEDLIKLLYINLPVWAYNKEVQSKVEEYYLNKNISASVVNGLLSKRTPLEGLGDVYLCMFTSAIYNCTKENKINPTKWFDEVTLSDEKMYSKKKLNDNRTIIIPNVDRINDHHYFSTQTPYAYTTNLLNNSLLGYKFETQRAGKVVLKGNQITKIPFLDPTNSEEIFDKMMLGTFTSNAISLNHEHTKDGDESKLLYDPINRTLKIELRPEETVWIIDGFHRAVQMSNVISKNPKSDRTTMMHIFNYTEEQANSFIRQEASGTKISKELLEGRSPDKFSTTIAKDINRQEKFNSMFGRIAELDKEVALKYDNAHIKYTSIQTISIAIEEFFGITNDDTGNKILISDLKDMLTDRLGEIISLKKKHFDRTFEDRKKSMVTFNGAFMFYIAIIARLNELGYSEEVTKEDRNKFSKKLAEILQKIDFSVTNPIWKELGIVTPSNRMKEGMNVSSCEDIKKYVYTVLIPDEVETLVSIDEFKEEGEM